MKFLMYEPPALHAAYAAEQFYVRALIEQILKAANCEVELLPNLPKNGAFIRDHFIPIHERRLVLTSRKTEDKKLMTQYLREALPDGYRQLALQGEYQGGNVIRVANTFFIGNHSYSASHRKAVAFVKEMHRNQKTYSQLRAFKFDTLKVVVPSRARHIFDSTYCHLDCFISVLPDGKVVLLNKKMLDQASLEKLITLVGEENIIDLEYANYISKPVMFNIVAIPLPNGRILLITPSLPEELYEKLEAQGYHIVSPASLTQANDRFNPELAKKVAEGLNENGWQVTEKNLVSSVPKKVTKFDLKLLRQFLEKAKSHPGGLIEFFNSFLDRNDSLVSIDRSYRDFLVPLGIKFSLSTLTGSTLGSSDDKAFIRHCLELIQAEQRLTFDFSAFNKAAGIPDSIEVILPAQKKPISLISERGSLHCLLQEMPQETVQPSANQSSSQAMSSVTSTVASKMPFFSLPTLDTKIRRKYKTKTDAQLPHIDTVLRRAVFMQNFADVKDCVERFGANVNAQDSKPGKGRTPLHWAAIKGNSELMDYLIQKGANPSIKDDSPEKRTPFDYLHLKFKELTASLEQSSSPQAARSYG